MLNMHLENVQSKCSKHVNDITEKKTLHRRQTARIHVGQTQPDDMRSAGQTDTLICCHCSHYISLDMI